MIRCRYYRWRLACLVDEGIAPRGTLLRHMETCAACRASHGAQRRVAEELRQGLAPVHAMSSPDLDFRGDSRSPQGPKKDRIPQLGRGLRTGAMAAGLLVLGYWGASRYLQEDSRQASAHVLVGAVTTPSELATRWMSDSAWMESPYTREVELLTSDAGRAVRFLAKCTVNPLSFTSAEQGPTGEIQAN